MQSFKPKNQYFELALVLTFKTKIFNRVGGGG